MIDLHVPSTASDGLTPPGELPGLAAKVGLSAVALTDHDTVAGVAEFLHAAEAFPSLTAIPGVELSTQYCSREMHIVGLFVDPGNGELQSYLAEQRRERAARAERMRARLTGLGYPITQEELHDVCGNDCPGRPHFAEILVRKFGFPDLPAVFDKLLKNGAPGYVPRSLPPPAAAIRAIHAAGGIAVWAHPVYRGHGERASVRRFLKVLVPAGLDGIEAFYSQFTPYQTLMLGEMAEDFHILRTGGTDYHGAIHPGVRIGTGCGELSVPDELFELMRRKRAEKPCR